MVDAQEPPLVGVRVLETATWFAGPSAGMWLADLGADVVKIELPSGDPARRFPPHLPDGTGIPFAIANRGKRSIVLDWRTPEGQGQVDRLLEQTDVMLVDAPVGSKSAAWPFHYQRRLAAMFPRLIYAAVSPFGRTGGLVDLPGYDPLVQAASGVTASSRSRAGQPVHAGFPLADTAGGMLLAYGIMMALLARQRTGRGQRVETSMLQAAVAMQSVQLVWAERDPSPPPASEHATVSSYLCGDGRYINIIVIQDRQWQGLCRVLDLEHLIEDPEFATWEARQRRGADLFPLLEGVLGTRPSAEWLPLLLEAGVPCGPTLSRLELFDDPQILANGLPARLTGPGGDAFDALGSPVSLSETPARPGLETPRLGQQTVESCLR